MQPRWRTSKFISTPWQPGLLLEWIACLPNKPLDKQSSQMMVSTTELTLCTDWGIATFSLVLLGLQSCILRPKPEWSVTMWLLSGLQISLMLGSHIGWSIMTKKPVLPIGMRRRGETLAWRWLSPLLQLCLYELVADLEIRCFCSWSVQAILLVSLGQIKCLWCRGRNHSSGDHLNLVGEGASEETRRLGSLTKSR